MTEAHVCDETCREEIDRLLETPLTTRELNEVLLAQHESIKILTLALDAMSQRLAALEGSAKPEVSESYGQYL